MHSQQIHIFLVRKSKKIINRVSQKEVANRVLGQNQEQWGQIFSWTQLGGLHPAWSLGKKQQKKTHLVTGEISMPVKVVIAQ